MDLTIKLKFHLVSQFKSKSNQTCICIVFSISKLNNLISLIRFYHIFKHCLYRLNYHSKLANWLNIFYPRFEFLLRNKTAKRWWNQEIWNQQKNVVWRVMHQEENSLECRNVSVKSNMRWRLTRMNVHDSFCASSKRLQK